MDHDDEEVENTSRQSPDPTEANLVNAQIAVIDTYKARVSRSPGGFRIPTAVEANNDSAGEVSGSQRCW